MSLTTLQTQLSSYDTTPGQNKQEKNAHNSCYMHTTTCTYNNMHIVKTLIKAALKYNYESRKGALFGAQTNYFRPLGVPCFERHLQIRAHLTSFQWTREVWKSWVWLHWQWSNWSMLYKAIMKTSAFGVMRSMKGSRTVEKLVVSKVAWVECEVSLNRKHPSKNIYDTKGCPR